MENIQFKKGVLELVVLSLLDEKEYYGYELVEEISRAIQIAEGTVYPILRRLKIEGMVDTYWEESKTGPPRKYYKLTKKGKEKYRELKKEWEVFIGVINKLLKGVRNGK